MTVQKCCAVIEIFSIRRKYVYSEMSIEAIQYHYILNLKAMPWLKSEEKKRS
jgi:hypothetical protein